MLGPLRNRFARSSLWAMTIFLTGTGLAGAEDVFFFRSLGELTITEGALPMGAESRFPPATKGSTLPQIGSSARPGSRTRPWTARVRFTWTTIPRAEGLETSHFLDPI